MRTSRRKSDLVQERKNNKNTPKEEDRRLVVNMVRKRIATREQIHHKSNKDLEDDTVNKSEELEHIAPVAGIRIAHQERQQQAEREEQKT